MDFYFKVYVLFAYFILLNIHSFQIITKFCLINFQKNLILITYVSFIFKFVIFIVFVLNLYLNLFKKNFYFMIFIYFIEVQPTRINLYLFLV